ncbi:MAG: hypothetical protein AB7U95_39880, partial [Reyranella sp.]
AIGDQDTLEHRFPHLLLLSGFAGEVSPSYGDGRVMVFRTAGVSPAHEDDHERARHDPSVAV